MTRPLVAFLVGLLFAVGLALSGMTDPAKVIGFLDLSGRWDPTLAFVMGGAVLVTGLAFPWILRRAPALSPTFRLPTATRVDARLIGGAAIFGVGWGLSGICPGPGLVALATLQPGTLAFVAAMAGSAIGTRLLERALLPAEPEGSLETNVSLR